MRHRAESILLGAFLVAILLAGIDNFWHGRTDSRKMFPSLVAQMVGIQVGVEANPVNTLAQQLREKENKLNEREKELALREAAVMGGSVYGKNVDTGWVIFGLLVVLFFLVGLNFYLDFRRRRKESFEKNIKEGPGQMGKEQPAG